MRLLNTTTFAFYEFVGNAIPDYAILSHRWEAEEVSFRDIQAGKYTRMKGFSKIKGCCEQAAQDGWEYAWVDSCCIDKSSSAELSEAINSMFKWYQKSQVCYVYLSDVPTGLSIKKHSTAGSEFRRSKWWKRGWTLQELIAPNTVIFYDSKWVEIGTKRYLESLISLISGISRPHLRNYMTASVAQKMSWASTRETTREEDMAYSLMGLFQVNMPPLYGEGMRAFERLQLQILADFDDESLFAWERGNGMGRGTLPGLLAYSPFDFRYSGDIYNIKARIDRQRPPFAMTNKGLHIELTLLPRSGRSQGWLSPLNCRRGSGEQVAIELEAEVEIIEAKLKCLDNMFVRTPRLRSLTAAEMETYGCISTRTVVFVKQRQQQQGTLDDLPTCRDFIFLLRTDSLLKHGLPVFQREVVSSNSANKMSRFRVYPAETFEKGQKNHTFVIGGYRATCWWLSFSGNTNNSSVLVTSARKVPAVSFFICLRMYTPTAQWTIRIVFPEERKEFCTLFSSDGDHDLDRASRRMKCGKSVSAVLKAGMMSGERVSVLDITIDPDGKLPWPDLSSMQLQE